MAHLLSPREQEILKLVVDELSSAEIALQLELSVRTVETHRKNIYRKTNTDNLVGLMKYAIRKGFAIGFQYTAPTITGQSVVRSLQYTGT